MKAEPHVNLFFYHITWQALIYPCACYLKIHSGRLSKMQVEIQVFFLIILYFLIFMIIIGTNWVAFNLLLESFDFFQITYCVLIIIVGVVCALIGTYSAAEKILYGEGDWIYWLIKCAFFFIVPCKKLLDVETFSGYLIYSLFGVVCMLCSCVLWFWTIADICSH